MWYAFNMKANHKPAKAAKAATLAPVTLPVVALTEVQLVTIEELSHVRRHVRVLKARGDELGAEIKGWLRGSGGGVYKGVLKASVSERAGQRKVDLARLATEFPEAYAACVSDGNTAEVLTLH